MASVHVAPERTADLAADGRQIAAVPLLASCVGSALGPAVTASTVEQVRTALDWMPGRILVLADDAMRSAGLAMVLRSAMLSTVAGVVVLVDDEGDPGVLGELPLAVPMVMVAREPDHELLRRAKLVAVEVRSGTDEVIDIRIPRPSRRRRSTSSVSHEVSGLVRS